MRRKCCHLKVTGINYFVKHIGLKSVCKMAHMAVFSSIFNRTLVKLSLFFQKLAEQQKI